MKLPFTSVIREWKELSRFRRLDRRVRSIVFYAEDGGAWVHFERILSELTGGMGTQVCYVTSSPNDPVLSGQDDRILTFCIGFGTARTVLFRTLDADVMVMTMPDLETFHIKRSPFPVHYVYVHHSIVSTHMVYRPAAFDHFDSILCVGPHHKEEIRAREKLYKLQEKVLVEHGYGRLESVIDAASVQEASQQEETGAGKRILIAPSWGDDALLETCGSALMGVLLEAGYQVVVRPHPITVRRSPKIIAGLRRQYGSNSKVRFDIDVASQKSLQDSDIMISDWSGAAFEYAFGLERPVLFIDVPRKVLNPEYEALPSSPIEVDLRSKLGAIVLPHHLDETPDRIKEIFAQPDVFRTRLIELRDRWIYNLGSSGAVGAAHIAKVAGIAD